MGLNMKKPSKRWLEFHQLIEIIDIRIGKKQRELVKLKNRFQGLIDSIDEKWELITHEQQRLKSLVVKDEFNGLSRLFQRRESVKSCIESLFFDVSVARQNADELELEIEQVVVEKRRLEKRKDALGEIQEQLRDEE
ncbi:hypothetical protein FM037_21895 [Shewanella psychropiezotolerans]|uniref:Uncharacterized protein n=3 Tax=Shewanellaceae TaxID=267890 RepID=A0A1S6HQ65_9GAMM|nr:hypothetical protein Sps_02484 [Shewanella psychrophila]QDO85417.1 hypothetical protein FM037_21895 [Shewanella psychropiezotolerans]